MKDETSAQMRDDTEWVGRRVIGAAIEVHRALGPGYKESIYVEALCIELHLRGLQFEREKPIKLFYKGLQLPNQRLDLLVEKVLVVECKVVEALLPVHTRQVASYAKAADVRLAFIFNSNVTVLMSSGFKRILR